MKRLSLIVAAAVLTTGCIAVRARESRTPQTPGEVVRVYATPTSPFARTLVIPPGYETIRLPGVVSDPLPGSPASAPAYGTTEQQTASALAKIATMLAEVGASEADVVAMTVYLVGAPEMNGAMDFDGMMRAYSRRYGASAQPNRPVRSTVQVAGLVRPGMLVEIEVTAARRR